jgi:pantoate kinase
VKKTTQAFAPGHVTGFFAIDTQSPDILKKGSLGAGFSLEQGTITRVTSANKDEIVLNPESGTEPLVSLRVLELLRKKYGIAEALSIQHDIKLPQGSGFGTSGAGAYSLALALEQHWGVHHSPLEAAAIAHQSEVENRTGLGTVAGQWQGGFKIRIKAGAPLSTRVVGFDTQKDITALFVVFGPLSTKDKLSDSGLREKINQKGQSLVQELQNSPGLENFMRMSRSFSEDVGLITPALRAVFDRLDKNRIISSQLMFGDGLFTLLDPDQGLYWQKELSRIYPVAQVFTCPISAKGGYILEH